MALLQMKPPRELLRFRRMAENKLVVLGFGAGHQALGIFTTIDGALWSMRHYQPYQENRCWWLSFYERDMLDKNGSYCHTVHDKIVRWVFGVKMEAS